MWGRIFSRRMTSLAQPLPKLSKGQYAVPNNPSYKKLMEKQTFYCANDGKMVWEKSSTDVMLYRLCCVLIGIGTIMSVETIRRLAAPPKNQ